MNSGQIDQHTMNTLAAQYLLCKLADDRRLEPPLSAFRAAGNQRGEDFDAMSIAF